MDAGLLAPASILNQIFSLVGIPSRFATVEIRSKEAAARIGLDPSFTFHELRHTWASLAVMNGAELIVVATNLGHRDTRMVERVYGHLTNSYLSRRVRETAPRYGFTAATNVVPLRGP